MRAEDLVLVSIDDHVIEPRDMFERHVPRKYRDLGRVSNVAWPWGVMLRG